MKWDFTPNKTDQIKQYDFVDLDYFFLAADGSIVNQVYPLDEMYNNVDTVPYSAPLTRRPCMGQSDVLRDSNRSGSIASAESPAG